MSRALAFMADPALAASVLPGPGDGFDIPAFLDSSTGTTVYLIARTCRLRRSFPCVAPLFAAMRPPRSTTSRPSSGKHHRRAA